MQVLDRYRSSPGRQTVQVLALSRRRPELSTIPDEAPAKATFTVPITYFIRDQSTPDASSWVTLPVASFPVDPMARRYSVKFHGFKRSHPFEGKTISWKPGELPSTVYHPAKESNDLVNGSYHIACGATWCNGAHGGNCNRERAEEYQNFYETEYGGKADISIYY